MLVTHLHGDHCFGLPGLMCLLSNGSHVGVEGDGTEGRIVQLVGPRGLRNMLRASLLASDTLTTYRFRVDELWRLSDDDKVAAAKSGGDGGAPPTASDGYRHFSSAFALPRHPCELDGLNVPPLPDGTWNVPPHPVPSPMGEAWSIHAASLRHGVECVGYAFRERPHAGKLDVDAVRDRITTEENRSYQRSERGIDNPLRLLGSLQRNEAVEILEKGRVATLRPEEFLGPPRRGRTVVVLGDTCDSREMAGLACGADLMIHESTNAAVDERESEAEVLATAVSRGHSTPRMAGSFARACRVRTLGLTHFSSRYRGDDSEESRAVMDVIVKQAREAFGRDEVFAATDLMEVEVPFRCGGSSGASEEDAGGSEEDRSMAVEEAVRRASAAADMYLRQAERTVGA